MVFFESPYFLEKCVVFQLWVQKSFSERVNDAKNAKKRQKQTWCVRIFNFDFLCYYFIFYFYVLFIDLMCFWFLDFRWFDFLFFDLGIFRFLNLCFFLFLFFSLMMILQLIFVYYLMPETKGISLEELSRTLAKKKL